MPIRLALRRGHRRRAWAGAVIAISLLIWPLVSTPQPAASRLALAPTANQRFGLDFVHGVSPDYNQPYPTPDPRYEKGKASGSAFTRWPLYWHRIEPSQDQFNYSSQDQVADLDIKNGLEVDAIIMGTPDWGGVKTQDGQPPIPPGVGPHISDLPVPGAGRYGAGAVADYTGYVPLGLQYPPFNADGSINQTNRWAYFIYKTVKRYMPGGELAQQRGWPAGKGIRYWEMWNEPDWPGVFWEGRPTDYARLLKVGYLAAKAADPQATVIFGGMQYWSNQAFFTQVVDEIRKDPDAKSNNYYFDVVAYHLYINPYNIYNVGTWVNNELAIRGMSKSIWVNETNLPVFDDTNVPDSPFCPGWQGTMDEQASYVIQASALALAAWVDKVFLFQLYDDNVGFREYYGLVRNNGTIRPSYTAYQVASTYFSDPISPTFVRLASGAVEGVSFMSSTQGKVTVLWNTTADQVTVSVPAVLKQAQWVDKSGNAQTITASNNSYSVKLPGKARYNISGCTDRISDQPGSPYILVEPTTTTLASRISQLPTTITTKLFPVSWSRIDSSGGNAVFDVQYRIGANGTWQDWLTNTTATSASFGPSESGKTYYFRARAKSGSMVEQYPDGDGDTFTTVKFYLTGRVLDNRGRPVLQASIAAALPGVSSTAIATTDGQGSFSLEFPSNGTYQVAVSRQGYGANPPKALGIDDSISYDFVLPPSGNSILNGGFENGLSGWITSGTVITQTFRHSGDSGATTVANGALIQNIFISNPTGQTTMAFFYRTPSPSATDSFVVQVQGADKTLSYTFPLSQNTWQLGWVDTSSIVGQAQVRFQFAGSGNLWLDEVSVGSSGYRVLMPAVSLH